MPRHSKSPAGLGSSALTPLLDTLFLLLFTLLATSRSAAIVEHAVREEVAVNLPSIEDGDGSAAGAEAELVTIAVDEGGGVRVLRGRAPAGESLDAETPAGLTRSLTRLVAKSSDVRVEIRADGEAQHAVVLGVLQAVRSAGCNDVRFIAVEAVAGSGSRPFGAANEPSLGGR